MAQPGDGFNFAAATAFDHRAINDLREILFRKHHRKPGPSILVYYKFGNGVQFPLEIDSKRFRMQGGMPK